MIRYTLLCAGDHSFESWFRDSAAYEALAAAGQVTCPACGGTEVRKALMTPSVVTSRARSAAPKTETSAPPPSPPAPVTPAPQPTMALLDDKAAQMRAALRELHRRMTEQAADVGRAFAQEARAIHEGEAPVRAIYGEASRDEVEALLDDGVPVLPVPILPDDHH